jgi:hypothetical protein
MAILDKRTEFADAVALNTGAAGTYNIGDQIDLGLAGRGIGEPGDQLYLVLQVATGIGAGSAGTVQFSLASDDSATLATNATQSIHLQTRAFATGTGTAAGALKAGTILGVFALPIEGVVYERYLGIQQVTGAVAITAGAVDAYLTPAPPAWKAYDAPFHL